MYLTIEQIKTIIKAAKKIKKQKNNKELAAILSTILDIVYKQTRIESLKNLERIINLYESYKEDDWFKQGLEEVLLKGNFPVEVINTPLFRPDPVYPFNPIQQPINPIQNPIISYIGEGTERKLPCLNKAFVEGNGDSTQFMDLTILLKKIDDYVKED